jgi:hypothetical protein
MGWLQIGFDQLPENRKGFMTVPADPENVR